MPSLDTMMSYHRLKRNPLDDSEIFTNLADLMEYCRTGASYNGQRVAVYENNILVEYVIKNGIPIIDMKGSEPIFKELNFGTAQTPNNGVGLLIYENTEKVIWCSNETFKFDDNKLCLLSQLEIFRQTDTNTFYFVYERISKSNRTVISKPFASTSIDSIESIINTNSDNDTIKIMPSNENDANTEANYITKIYIKADNYYNALNS